MVLLFPDPGGPTVITPCRTSVVSYSWMTFRHHEGCGISPSFSMDAFVAASTLKGPEGECSGGQHENLSRVKGLGPGSPYLHEQLSKETVAVES